MAVPRPLRYYQLRLMRLNASPRSLALGSAIGAAIGAAPTLPLNNILTLFFTLTLRVNPVAGILGATLFSNPFTFVPQYFLSWKIGNFLLPNRLHWSHIHDLILRIKESGVIDNLDAIRQLGWDAILVLMTGGIFLAVPCGLLTYFVVYRFSVSFQRKRRQRHLLNRHSR